MPSLTDGTNQEPTPSKSSGIAAIELFNSGNHCEFASLCRCRGRFDSKRGTVSDEITIISAKQGRTLGTESKCLVEARVMARSRGT